MDAVLGWTAPGDGRSVEFVGTWKEFLPIAVTNLALTIVTLGIYRFWAKARERRYLWSRTRIIDAELEWTGTGGEMFVGFLIAMGVLFGSLIAILLGSFLVGDWFLIVGMIAFYLFVFWAIGFAQFRALRYRLSRTWWRGIRGGSAERGTNYGWHALGRNFLGGLTLGLLIPSAIVENWNERLSAMSFGPHRLESSVDTDGLLGRWLMVYPVYIGFLALVAFGGDADAESTSFQILGPFILLLALPLVMVSFWALFMRKAAAAFAMGELTAGFEVSTVEWLKFYAKAIGLTVITLGLGSIMWGYWRWEFVMDRLALFGTVNLDTLTQSETIAPTDAEGLADAFDIGAF